MKHFILSVHFLFLSFCVFAQSVTISDVPTPADPSAGLEVRFNDRGVLFPRLTQSEINGIAAPATGLLLFNTTTQCLQIFHVLQGWTDISCDCPNPPTAGITASSTQIGSGGAVAFQVSQPAGGLTYQWSFPGGQPGSSTASSVSVTYSQAGTYTAQLVVSDAAGCTATDSVAVTVANCPAIGVQTQTFSNSSTGRFGSIQTWTVPAGICFVRIQASGAQGGGVSGGLGATVTGEFNVTGGEVLRIIVGQSGGVTSQSASFCGGGGGASYVYRDANDPLPLLVAAGGGGQSQHGSGGGGSATSVPINGGGPGSGAGGSGGNGGAGGLNTGVYSCGSGGAGWLSNGIMGQNLRNPPGEGGFAPRNSGNGGLFTHPSYVGADGGFGGGGGASDNSGAGGGGGGFNGGGGGNNYTGSNWGAGGGGGSYNGGTNTSGTNANRSGHGQVVITW
jgi:hypothetical protein